jgi:ubiquitin C-terminal hydrolase
MDKADNSIVEGAYHLTQEYEKPSGKKRPSQLCPSYIADMEKDLCAAFERKRVYLPENRPENTFIGLKNLGATCYMNALLQALYLDTTFRQAVFNWKGTPEEDEICYQLQIVFAGLQNLNRTVFDTRPFTNAMGVLASIQQDAQEFFKFLMSHVEEVFKNAEPFETGLPVQSKNFIPYQYEGLCENYMKCSSCKTASGKESNFLEILVSLNDEKCDVLQSSIKEYIGVELLREDNRYHCGKCNSKQDAECSIQITKLPQILNFQVLRFDYDIKLMKRKKKTTTLYFPVEIDMTPFMKGKSKKQLKRRKTCTDENLEDASEDGTLLDINEDDNGDNIYELTSYLIHKGVNAESGHYIAHAKDEKSGNWYLFNDEVVKPLEINANIYVKNYAEMEKEKTPKEQEKGTREGLRKKPKKNESVINIDMSDEEDFKKSKNKVIEKKLDTLEITPEGYFKCESCYFLSYTKKNIKKVENPVPPDHIVKVIEIQNSDFEVEYEKAKDEESILLSHRRAHEEEFNKFWKSATVKGGRDAHCFWMLTSWLRKWVEGEFSLPDSEDDGSVVVINKSPIMYKVMDNSLITCEHGKLSFANIDLMKRVSEDLGDHFIRKYGEPDKVLTHESYCEKCCDKHAKKETGFVEMCEIRDKFILEHEEYLKSLTIVGFENRKGFYIAKKWITTYKNMKTVAHYEKLDQQINSLIACEIHENMIKTISKIQVVIISKSQWDILKSQFPAALEFSTNTEPCPCFQNVERKEQREKMPFFTTPKCDKPPKNDEVHYFIPYDFFYCWQQYTSITSKEMKNRPRPAQKISMDTLLCDHGKLCFDPHSYWKDTKNIDNQVFRIADENTYTQLSKYYDVDGRKVTTDMESCKECCEKGELEKLTQDTVFEHASMMASYKVKKELRKTRVTKNSAQTSEPSSVANVQYVDMEVYVDDVNFLDTVYVLKLKFQQVLDYAPNRLKIAQGDTLLEDNQKSLYEYGVKQSIPFRLTILDIADEDEFFNFSNGKENMTGVGFSNTKLGNKSKLDNLPTKEVANKMDDDDKVEITSPNNNNNNNNNTSAIIKDRESIIQEIKDNLKNKFNNTNNNKILSGNNGSFNTGVLNSNGWTCLACTCLNPPNYLTCDACQETKPSQTNNNSDFGFREGTSKFNNNYGSGGEFRKRELRSDKKTIFYNLTEEVPGGLCDPPNNNPRKHDLNNKIEYHKSKNNKSTTKNNNNNNNNNSSSSSGQIHLVSSSEEDCATLDDDDYDEEDVVVKGSKPIVKGKIQSKYKFIEPYSNRPATTTKRKQDSEEDEEYVNTKKIKK